MSDFFTSIDVRYAETDQMGVVYHANYFIYFDLARTALIGKLGFPYHELEKCDQFLMVIEAQCKYRAPIRFGDQIKVKTLVVEVRKLKIKFDYQIIDLQGQLLAEGFTVLGSVDQKGKPKPISENMFNELKKFQENKSGE